MALPFRPGLAPPDLVDLSESSDDLLLGGSREDLAEAARRGDTARLARIGGHWAVAAKDGVTVRLARTLARPLRYFVAKHATGPFLVVADRIDAIARWCAEKGIAEQFHPSYTRLAPAHCLTELDQVGCPDPNPRYRRFFSPETGNGRADPEALGRHYVQALAKETSRVLAVLPEGAPLAVAFSGGADSTATAAVLLHLLRERGEADRLRLYTLSIGGGSDAASAREGARAIGAEELWEALPAPPSALDMVAAVRALEDYRPLDVACGAAMRAFLSALRARRPDLVFLFDGDGGDENWKAYPVEDSDLTIKSVLANPLLYHEGWGVDSIKHSLTYSGGLSRGVVRGFAPAREFGFRLISPHTLRPVVAAALSAPLHELVGEDVTRLYALKGEVVRAGLASLGFTASIAPKKRFQEGATAPEVFRSRLVRSRAELRRIFEDRYGPVSREERQEAPSVLAGVHSSRGAEPQA